jgi:hypothetical protein
MSTVAEIKDAVDKLSPPERAQLESLLWPDWDRAVMTPELERLLDEGLENLDQAKTTDELRRRS